MVAIPENVRIKAFMEGAINNHHFKCEAEGEGKPYEGTQLERIRVTEGGPLPFSFDILSPHFQYGSVAITKYLSGIPDYFKQSFPEGFSWERTTMYEDGGYVTAHQDTSLDGNCLVYKIKVIGSNLPANGPVMQNKTRGWEPCTEMRYVRGGVLCGQSLMALKCADGNHLTCQLRTTYRSKKPAKKLQMPAFHFSDHRPEILKVSENGNLMEQYEMSVGRYCESVPSKLGHN
uniref:Blue chromoprotein, sgBP n=1 Tax=Stichodactyla gigantea TaxID=230562 RepID=A0A0M3KL34_STIGI